MECTAQVWGSKAFSEGASATFANFVQNEEVFKEATDEEAKNKLGELVKRFLTLAPEKAAQIAQIVTAANTIREITGN